MKRLGLLLALLLVLGLSRLAVGEEHPQSHTANSAHSAGHATEGEVYPHPQIAEPSTWPGFMLLVVIGMFLSAAVVGPIVRANAPEEVPPAHSHDEPPGASHHHGASGTHVVDPHD